MAAQSPLPPMDYEDFGSIYSPSDTAAYTVEFMRQMASPNPRSSALPIEGIDGYFVPVRPGQMAGIIGQASHYKSGLMHSIERRLALGLAKSEDKKQRAIFHCSTEEDIEEQGMLEMGYFAGKALSSLTPKDAVDWDLVMDSSVKMSSVAVYRIGTSMARPGTSKAMYLANLLRMIEWGCERYNLEPAGMFFDYLQAFPLDPRVQSGPILEQRRLQVREDVYAIKEAAKDFGCAAWVAIQAKQELKGNPSSTILLPGKYDGEETSAIAQRFDRLLSVWMPAASWPIGRTISMGSGGQGDNAPKWDVEEDMLFIRVLKQRGNLPAGRIWLCRIDFDRNEIAVDRTLAGAR